MIAHTPRHRTLTVAVTSLAALMLLTGCQSSSSGDGGLGSSDTSTSSSSGASASKSTKSKSASASSSASPSATATGTQIVPIGGPDVPDTEDASAKAAYQTIEQVNRLENQWGDGAQIDPGASEDLKKFMAGEALTWMQNALEKIRQSSSGNNTGMVRVGWIGTDNAGKIEHKDKTYEHGSIQMRVCEDLSQMKNPDGSQSFPVEKSKRTMRADIVRGADGHFYLISYRVDHYGCH